MDLFNLAARLTLDKSAYEKGIREARNTGKEFANNSQSIMSRAAASLSTTMNSAAKVVTTAFGAAYAGASAAATALVKDAFKAYAELEKNLGGSEVVWKEYAANIQMIAKDAYKNAGLSMSEYLSVANRLGALLQGSGLSEGEAFETATKAIQAAADTASIMGVSVGDAMNVLIAMGRGTFTTMDNLGVVINDEILKQYALKKGIVNTSKATQASTKGIKQNTIELTKQQQIQLAFQKFMEDTADYAGNYAKENDTLAGSFTTLKSAFDNWISGADGADPVGESLDLFLDALSKAAEKILPNITSGIQTLAEHVKEKLPEIIQQFMPVIVSAATGILTVLPDALGALLTGTANGIIGILNEALGTNIPEISEIKFPSWTELQQMAKVAVDDVIDGINALFGLNLPHIEDIKLPSWADMSETASATIQPIIDGINAIFNPADGTGGIVINIVGALLKAFDDMLTAVGGDEVDGKIGAVFTALESALRTAAGKIVGLGITILDRVLSFGAGADISTKYANFMKRVSYGLLRSVDLVLNLGGQILDQILGYASDGETGTKIQSFMLEVSQVFRTKVTTIAGLGLAILGRLLSFVGDPTRAAQFGIFMTNVSSGLVAAVGNILQIGKDILGRVLEFAENTDVQTAYRNFMTTIGTGLGGAVDAIVSAALGIVEKLLEIGSDDELNSQFDAFMGIVGEGLKTAVSNVAKLGLSILRRVLMFAGSDNTTAMFKSFMTNVSTRMSMALSSIGSLATEIVGQILSLAGDEDFSTAVGNILTTVGEYIGTGISTIGSFALTIIDTILSIVGGEENATAFTTFMGKVREGLSNAVTTVASAAGGILDAFVTYLGQPEARQKFITFMQTLARNLGENVRTVFTTAGKIIGGFITWLASDEGRAKVGEMMTTIGAALGESVDELASVAASIVGTFVNYMIRDEGWKKLGKALYTIFDGFATGIDQIIIRAWDKITGFDRLNSNIEDTLAISKKSIFNSKEALDPTITIYNNPDRRDEIMQIFKDIGLVTDTGIDWVNGSPQLHYSDEYRNSGSYRFDENGQDYWAKRFRERAEELRNEVLNPIDTESAKDQVLSGIDAALSQLADQGQSSGDELNDSFSTATESAENTTAAVNALGNSIEAVPDEKIIDFTARYNGFDYLDTMFADSHIAPHAKGMGYVPYDGYIAELHRGEQIVMANNARKGGDVDTDAIIGAVTEAITTALANVKLILDDEVVGEMMTSRISKNIAQAARGRRFAT